MSCSCEEMSCNWCGNLNTKSEILETATIEDLKQNEHVQGLIEALRFYGENKTWLCSSDPQFGDLITYGDLEENSSVTKRKFVGGKLARAKLSEWEL